MGGGSEKMQNYTIVSYYWIYIYHIKFLRIVNIFRLLLTIS